MRTILSNSFLALVFALAATGCDKPKAADPNRSEPAIGSGSAATATNPGASAGNAGAAAKAKEIFAQRCTPCHGATGAGDGAASASLTPRPRNFHDPEWQKSVTDEHIQTIIKVGGAAVGKSPAMPGNPDLTDPAMVTALKDVIRGFGS
jgi:mono/diheme cytochrome c family protein